ncbi:hypothetical protein Klosneuvirus_5_89 [Klosneuvirus KNV1]|uniref:Uncharacterized protein n=1 Tax=Klosneuvirus KNV1 TaxID=1977640 RepID=A0A1V0SL00_9VIRU|nr:hypothetical protein Klosneuvirus_5_89 [Klosneuvirus KNV1]
MSNNIDKELTTTEYKFFRLIHTKYNYQQDCVMALTEQSCDIVIHKLKNLFASDNKHMLISDCDAISNIKVIFSHYIPLGMTIELRQFARNKKNIQRINYKIIDNRTIHLQLDQPINIVYYNHNSYLYFNMKSEAKNNIYLEYDVIYVNNDLRNKLLNDDNLAI